MGQRNSYFLLRIHASILGLGLVGALTAEGKCLAQDYAYNPKYRLTVNPRQMATGTRNERAGRDTLDAPGATVYVPPRCVGTQRCPLIVNWGGVPQRILDQYGWIGLHTPGFDRDVLDRALQEVLRKFAIDPKRIAISGRCATGRWPMYYGDNNPHVFRRMMTFTSDVGYPLGHRGLGHAPEYFLNDGILDRGHNLGGARLLRQRGYTVKHVVSFRDHTFEPEDYDFMGRWLHESWTIPDPAFRPAPYTFPDPPLLKTNRRSPK